MKIKVPFEKLKREINKAVIACSKTGQNSTLKSLLLKTEINSLVIRSTNIDIGYECVMGVNVETEGEFSILGDVFSRLLNTVNTKNNSECEIIYENNLCTLNIENHSFSLKTTQESNFPKLPNVSGVEIVVDNQIFLNGLKSVVFSVAKSDLKPEISGVFVSILDEDLVFVATDAYRLCEKSVKVENANFPEVKCIIPEKNVKDIIRFFEDFSQKPGEKDLKITFSKNSLLLNIDNTFVVTRLIEGNFPNYKQIIPNEPVSNAIFLKEDLFKSLKIVSFFGDKTQQINLSVENDKSFMEATSIDIGNTKEEVSTTLKGDGFSVKINSKYLEEFLQNSSDSSIILKFTAQNKALIVQGIMDTNYTYLIMPSYR